jgi:hypothetical protein
MTDTAQAEIGHDQTAAAGINNATSAVKEAWSAPMPAHAEMSSTHAAHPHAAAATPAAAHFGDDPVGSKLRRRHTRRLEYRSLRRYRRYANNDHSCQRKTNEGFLHFLYSL